MNKILILKCKIQSTDHDSADIYLHTPAGCRIGFSFGRVYYMNIRILCSLIFNENHGVVIFTDGIPDVLSSISRLCKLFFFLLTFNMENQNIEIHVPSMTPLLKEVFASLIRNECRWRNYDRREYTSFLTQK